MMTEKVFNESVFIARNIMLRKKEGVLPRYRWRLSALRNWLELQYELTENQWNEILTNAKRGNTQ